MIHLEKINLMHLLATTIEVLNYFEYFLFLKDNADLLNIDLKLLSYQKMYSINFQNMKESLKDELIYSRKSLEKENFLLEEELLEFH